MTLHSELPEHLNEVDIIIAGGGTSGCVVAARLAESDPSLSILVVEGGSNNDGPNIRYPLLFFSNLLPETRTALFYKGKTGNREIVVQSGGVLGGGSSINLMTYSRPQKSDLDGWKIPGWSAADMLPYFQKFETYHGPGKARDHGSNGPISVSKSTKNPERAISDFIKAAESLGYPEVQDLTSFDTPSGVQRNLRYISPEGRRQDVVSQYLRPKLEDTAYPNLHVVVEHNVVRVVIENGKATGIEMASRNGSSETGHEPCTRFVKASKMVIVSCGALGTPLVLERSGLGDHKILERHNIPVEANLTGVGRNYQDHQMMLYSYRSSLDPDETLDALLRGQIDPADLIQRNDPMLGWNAQDVTSKIRPTDEQASAFEGRFREVWDSKYKPYSDRPLVHLTLIPGYTDPTTLGPGQYFSISAFTVYPESRGHIHVNGSSAENEPDFNPGFFTDDGQVDVQKHLWTYKRQREIARRMATYRGEVANVHPPFPPSSQAACIELTDPLVNVTDIVYTPEDDAIIEKWIRDHVGTTWHSLGTCKMAPLSEGGVVNAKLAVHNVQNLKIADLSIVPVNVAGNTNSMALAIGEKAAEIFVEELLANCVTNTV